jgi:hypothetical protein
MTEQAKSPQDVPAAYESKLQELAKPARTLMDLKGLPYFVQYGLASQGYVTIEDLGDRWDTPQKAREEGPEALGFKSGEWIHRRILGFCSNEALPSGTSCKDDEHTTGDRVPGISTNNKLIHRTRLNVRQRAPVTNIHGKNRPAKAGS